MLTNLKQFSYFYIVTLPFTFITLEFVEKSDAFLLTPILNIFVALSAFTYIKKIRPMVDNDEKKATSVSGLKTLLWITIIISLLFSFHRLASNVDSIESDVSQIDQDVSNIQMDISYIQSNVYTR